MVKKLLIVLGICCSIQSFAQTNTFPSSGNVGIGTTSPAYPLTLTGVSNPEIYIKSTAETYSNWGFRIYQDSTPTSYIESLGRNLTIAMGWSNILRLGDPEDSSYGGNIYVPGASIGICTTTPRSKIDIWGGQLDVTGKDHNGTAIVTSSSGVAYFSDNSLTNGIAITSSGNVGLGTTSPSNLLTLNTGNARNGILITSGYTTTGGLSDITLNKSSTSGMTSGLADAWDISLRDDGYFTGSPQNTGLSLEFFAGRIGGGYYAPLSFASNGNLILVSDKNATSGNVLIGETSQVNSSYKLDVNGNIRADKLVVNTTGADYVFDRGYHLPSLDSLNNYIKANHHLPGIKPASQMQQQGMDVGENQIQLLQKVEELTLYVIRQQNEIDSLKQMITKSSK